MRVQPLKEGLAVHPLAARCVFWELAATVADPEFEKEAWLSAALLQFGPCGFTIGDIATVYFCSPDLSPGVAKMPTAPVSDDAAVVTSLFRDSARVGLEAVLLDAALVELVSRDFPAVEAFGFRDEQAARELLGVKPGRIGMLAVDTLESAGFRVTRDDPVIPRLRLELPPAYDLLSDAAVEDLLARALA